MNIRTATQEDVPRLSELALELFLIHTDFDPVYYELEKNPLEEIGVWIKEQMEYPQRFLFVAEEDGHILGFIAGYIKGLFPWFKIKSVGHVAFLVVDPGHRNKRIGKLLEEHATQWFKDQHVPYVEVYADEKNTISKKAWSSYGFSSFKAFLRKKI